MRIVLVIKGASVCIKIQNTFSVESFTFVSVNKIVFNWQENCLRRLAVTSHKMYWLKIREMYIESSEFQINLLYCNFLLFTRTFNSLKFYGKLHHTPFKRLPYRALSTLWGVQVRKDNVAAGLWRSAAQLVQK